MSSESVNQGAQFYGTANGKLNARIIGHSCATVNMEMLSKYGQFDSTIFLGLGEGELLAEISPHFSKVTVVEASDLLVNEARQRFAERPGLQFVNAYFESFEPAPSQQASSILGNHSLEHLDNPVDVLRKSRTWLKPNGIAIFTVPNATSLHRRIGVELGILKRVNDLSDQDRFLGHHRVYDAPRLKADILESGYTVVEAGGFNLKLVSQAQMADWPTLLHNAIYRVSRECPTEMCSNLYVVSRPQ